MADNIDVKIGAQVGDLKAGMAQATDAVKQMQSQVTSHLKQMGNSFDSLNSSLLNTKNVIAAVATYAMHEIIEATVRWQQSVIDISRTLGISTEAASVYAVALKETGNSAGAITEITALLERRLRATEYVYSAVGIATRNANGSFRNAGDVLRDTLKTLLQYKEGSDRNIMSQELLGRGWSQVAHLLKMNDEAMKQAAEDAKILNMILGEDGKEKAEQLEKSLNYLKLTFEALAINIGTRLMPLLQELGNWFRTVGPSAINVIAAAIGFVIDWLKILWEVVAKQLRPILDDLASWFSEYGATAFVAFVSGPLTVLTNALQAAALGFRVLYEVAKATAESLRPIIGAMVAALRGDFKGAKDEISRFADNAKQAWSTAFENIANASRQTHDDIINTWSKGAGSLLGTPGIEKGGPLAPKPSNTEGTKSAVLLTDPKKITELEIDAARQAELAGLEQRKETINQRRTLDQIDAEQQIQELKALEDKKFEAEVSYLQMRRALYSKPEEVEERQKIDNQIQAMTQKHNLDMLKLNNQLSQESLKNWNSMLDSMQSSMTSSIQQMFRGQQTFMGMLRNLWMAALDQFIAIQVKILFAHIKGETSKTLATGTATAERTAIQTAGAKEGILISAWASVKEIVNAGWTAAANAYKAIAAIPFVGPFLAPAAAIGAAAAVHSFASRIASAAGGFDVPRDTITQLHKNEMVLPASLADRVRNMTDSGKGGQTTHVNVNMTIQAWDGRDARRAIMNSAPHIMDAIKGEMRNFNT